MKPTLLILAAGMGSRYGGIKQLDPLGPSGETIMDYSIYDAIQAGFGRVVFVIRKSIEKDFTEVVLSRYAGKIATDYVFQELNHLPEGFSLPADREKPWGTAHAVLAAAETIREPFGIINADDFYGAQAYRDAVGFLSSINPEDETAYCMMGYPLRNTLSEYGTVSRGICLSDSNKFLQEVTERTKIGIFDHQVAFIDEIGAQHSLSGNELVSMNFWGANQHFFKHLKQYFADFLKDNIKLPKSEFYIPTAIDKMIKNNEAKVKVIETHSQWFGVTYQEDRPGVVAKLQQLVKAKVYPSPLW